MLRRFALRVSQMADNLEEGRKLTAVWGAAANLEDWEAISFSIQAVGAVKANLIRNGIFLVPASLAAREREGILGGTVEVTPKSASVEENVQLSPELSPELLQRLRERETED